MSTTLAAILLPGINTDSLGSYLAALGLLTASSKRWSGVRGCWSEGVFVLLSDEIENCEMLMQYLRNDWTPTDYERWWTTSQKTSKRKIAW